MLLLINAKWIPLSMIMIEIIVCMDVIMMYIVLLDARSSEQKLVNRGHCTTPPELFYRQHSFKYDCVYILVVKFIYCDD